MELSEVTDPLGVVFGWIDEAVEAGETVPEAVSLSTIGRDGFPNSRIVLLKGRDGDHLRFFTNYRSTKAQELAQEPQAAMVLHHPRAARQARFRGRVEKMSAEGSDRYFDSRPRLSQLGAWASAQSTELSSRDELERALGTIEEKFSGRQVPRPDFWGGYVFRVDEIELWIGREGRLHDRAAYSKVEKSDGASTWTARLLWP
ncbi:MAG: pyridoxamine 5'-phosphate oxidase [Polyangiaceae bacterium]|nr:pyridoxamine 5'-phosphate oxidase [Polyangiaceae bacterium]